MRSPRRAFRFTLAVVFLGAAIRDASAWEVPAFFGGGEMPVAGAGGQTAECPKLVIENGAAALRTPPDADAASVQHQISLGAVTRECSASGPRLSIRLRIEGYVILGPMGRPGNFHVGLRVVVRRNKDGAVLSERNFQSAVTIEQEAVRGGFTIAPEPVSVPNSGAKAPEDYEISVALSEGAGEPAAGPAKIRKKRRRGR